MSDPGWPPHPGYEPTRARPLPGYEGGVPAPGQMPPAVPPYGVPPNGMPPAMPPNGMPPYGYPPQPMPPQSLPPRPRRVWPWAIAAIALVCVIALVIGGIVRWGFGGGDNEPQALLSGQLGGAYPTAPSAHWTLTASELGGGQFYPPTRTAPVFPPGFYPTSNETTAVSLFGTDSNALRVVGINGADGKHWISQETIDSCADAIVDGRIACVNARAMVFFDTGDGTVLGRVALPSEHASFSTAYNGDAGFTRFFDGGGVTIVKATPSGTAWTKSFTYADTIGGDAYGFTATPSLVASASGGTVVVASAVDGREIINRPGAYAFDTLADGSILVQLSQGGQFGSDATVVRPDGTVVTFPGTAGVVPRIASPGLSDSVIVNDKLTSVSSQQSTWTTPLPRTGDDRVSSVPLADKREVIAAVGNNLVSVDTESGQPRWTATVGDSGGGVPTVTDGTRLIAATRSGLVALDLETGAQVWSMPGPTGVIAAGSHMVAGSADTITGFAPSGGDAVAPGAPTPQEPAPEGTVTQCGSVPKFTPERFRTTAAGLVATMKVVATCPDGDVMSGTSTRITITDSGKLVASGTFDFSRSPTAVPSSESDAGVTLDLTYPPGSFYRTPDTLGQAGGTAAGQFAVDCDRGPQSKSQLPAPQAGSTAPPLVATGPAVPQGTDIGATTGDALRAQADADRAFILANLNNRWVAQLSSKRPGLFADGRVWDSPAILDEFLGLRLRFNDVRLLYSSEWSVFSQPGWWVTVAALTFPGPDQANAWCSAQGFDGDHCFAKLVSTTAPPDGSTRYR